MGGKPILVKEIRDKIYFSKLVQQRVFSFLLNLKAERCKPGTADGAADGAPTSLISITAMEMEIGLIGAQS